MALPVASEGSRVKAKDPVSPRNCRKKPATLVPAIDTNV